jgi:hypothetical protein
MQMTIGADELILWLRKNNKAVGEENLHLGRKIFDLVKNLGGKSIIDNHPSIWANDMSDAAMANLGLPQTSEQYSIDSNLLPKLYEALDQW